MGDVDRRRGRLIVYLGSAPGVGKTYAALGEAHRRLARGTDVVIGFVETHGREQTAAQLEGLEVVPRRDDRVPRHHVPRDGRRRDPGPHARRWCWSTSWRTPTCRAAGTTKRAQDVEELRAAGIDVITTVNIQHLESLNDEVERITGVRQRETVPDEVVRTADQIQLVDMSPDALRRRMAHGNIYKPDKVDASLTSYFRVGNLTALRELALLWLADRVDDQLDDYRRAHRIQETWPAKERIVVAVTGGPESETLIRRGARLAQRAAGAELLAVHVIATDGLHSADERRLGRAQELVASVGWLLPLRRRRGRLGRRGRLRGRHQRHDDRRRRLAARPAAPALHRDDGRPDRLARRARSTSTSSPTTRSRVGPCGKPMLSPLSPGRQATGWVGALALPTLLTWVLHGFARHRPAAAGHAHPARLDRRGRPGRRAAARAAGRGGRLPHAQLLLHPADRHPHRRRAEEPCWRWWSSWPWPPRSRPWSTAPRAGPPRPCAPAPRPQR